MVSGGVSNNLADHNLPITLHPEFSNSLKGLGLIVTGS